MVTKFLWLNMFVSMILSNYCELKKIREHVVWYRTTIERIANEENDKNLKTNLEGIANDLRVTEILSGMVLEMVSTRESRGLFADVGK